MKENHESEAKDYALVNLCPPEWVVRKKKKTRDTEREERRDVPG